MEARIVRYSDLRPCYNAFIDTRSPGSETKENFTIIGPGVSENPAQHVHIPEAHGFNIGGARQPPGCVNSQHSHDTAEVFVVHSGHWRFTLGERGEDAHVDLAPGDTISLHTRMFRGFTATATADDGSPGFLWAVLGGDDPGRVTWAPYVFDMARHHGLILLETGALLDTAAGEALPDGARPMPRTSAEQVAALHVPSPAEAEAMIARDTPVGLVETPVIGPGGKLDWPHGFTLARLDIAAGMVEPCAAPTVKTVLFIHRGTLRLDWDGGDLTLGEGDTLSVPVGLPHTLAAEAPARAFVVRAVV